MLLAQPTCGYFTFFVDWLVAVGWPLCRLVALCVAQWVCYSWLLRVGRFIPIAVGWSLWAGRCVGWSLCRLIALGIVGRAVYRWLYVGQFISIALCRSLWVNCCCLIALNRSMWVSRSGLGALGRLLWISRCGGWSFF